MIVDIPPSRIPAGTRLSAPARQVAGRALRWLFAGEVRIVERDTTGEPPTGDDSTAPTMWILDSRAWVAIAKSASAGLGEAYFRGWWTTDDLPGLLRRLVRGIRPVDELRGRAARMTGVVTDPVRRLRRPDLERDRQDIHAHYDVGDDFFELVLDESMTYSCARFSSLDQTLAEAQAAKLDGWFDRLRLEPGHSLVEIGTGWGSLAVRAAETRGVEVTTTTVSDAQFERTARLVSERDLDGKVELANLDYRMLEGRFDRLVSVEMIEAVDWREYDDFFRTCERLLEPDGLAGFQAIVISDDRFDRAKSSADFIKRWIFPGGCLPSVSEIARSLARTRLRIIEMEDLGAHYAETLGRWRSNLLSASDKLQSRGYDEQIQRLFEFYFAYCEAAFAERHVSVVQILTAGPEWRTGI